MINFRHGICLTYGRKEMESWERRGKWRIRFGEAEGGDLCFSSGTPTNAFLLLHFSHDSIDSSIQKFLQEIRLRHKSGSYTSQ